MSDIGKAIYLACSALLFIFAATTSIYLYTTLNTHMDVATEIANVYDRAEGEALNPPEKRKVTWGEIYITLTKMEQMHVSKVIIGVKEFTAGNVSTADLNWVKSNISDVSKLKYLVSEDAYGNKIVTYKNS